MRETASSISKSFAPLSLAGFAGKDCAHHPHAPLFPWHSTLPPRPVVKHIRRLCLSPKHPSDAFATTILDNSMMPVFEAGTRLVFCPKRKPTDRCYLLVQPHDSPSPILRQLIITSDFQYLKPLNPNLDKYQMQALDKNDTIIGVLIEARRDYGL